MSATEASTIVTGVDFVSVATTDLDRSVAFYGETLGLPCSAWRCGSASSDVQSRA